MQDIGQGLGSLGGDVVAVEAVKESYFDIMRGRETLRLKDRGGRRKALEKHFHFIIHSYGCAYWQKREQERLRTREKRERCLRHRSRLPFFPSFFLLFLALQSGEGGVGAQGISQSLGSLGGDAVATKAKKKCI